MASWMKYIVLFVSVLFSTHLYAAEPKIKFCVYTYYTEHDLTVCSQYELKNKEVAYIDVKYVRALDLYIRFAHMRHIKIVMPDAVPTVYMTHVSILSDANIFPDITDPEEKVLARYVRKLHYIFLDQAILEQNNTDFEHEISHLINEYSGISTTRSEELARSFERYIGP